MSGNTKPFPSLGLFVTVITAVLVGLFSLSAAADPPSKTRVTKEQDTSSKGRSGHDDRRDEIRVDGRDDRRDGRRNVRRERPTKSYVPTRRDYGHVRVVQPHRRADGTINIRPIIGRCSKVTPVVLARFEDKRRSQVELVISLFKKGERSKAVEIWGSFVTGLAEYHEPVDLDEVMLYVVREGCARENDAMLFHAARLQFLRDTEEQLEDYVDLLDERRDSCRRSGPACPPTTQRDIETERIRARANLEIVRIEADVQKDIAEGIIATAHDYESRFAAAYEDLYREVDVRVRFSN